MHSSQAADRITCVIKLTIIESSCKLREKISIVVGTEDSSVSETIGHSGAVYLAWDSIHDGLVSDSVANLVFEDVDAPIASVDSCHVDGRSSLVCLEGARVLAEAAVVVLLEHVLSLNHGHLFLARIN